MHWIQRHIIIKLITQKQAKYSELVPEGVDGNLFSYHLKLLITSKLIEKVDGGYSLTSFGKRKVATLSLTASKEIELPRVFAMIYIENEEGQICLFEWQRQPYLGHTSIPFNRVVYGSSIIETAKETLTYKTGLSGELEFAGTANVIVTKKETPCTHYIAHIYRAPYKIKTLNSDGMTGKPFWGVISDFSENQLVYGITEIVELLKTKKSPFFEEILIKR